jgi:hypothetical protein
MPISASPIQDVNGGAVIANGGTLTVSAPANGNLCVLTSRAGAAANAITSITQTNVTWTKAIDETASTLYAGIWKGIVSGGAGGTTLTINSGGAGVRVDFTEWSGFAVSIPTDATGTNTNTSSTTSTGTISPTAGFPELIIATGNITTGLSSGPTGGFTALSTSNVQHQSAYLVVSSTSGTYSTSWTGSGSGQWDCVFASFESLLVDVTLDGIIGVAVLDF